MSDTELEVRQVLLTVKRKTNTIPAVVMSHEVPIIQALHGKDVVELVDLDYDTIKIPNDAQAEYERLLRNYGDKASAIIRSIYPTPQALAQQTGISLADADLGAVSEDPAQAVVIDPRREAKKAEKAKAAKAAKAA